MVYGVIKVLIHDGKFLTSNPISSFWLKSRSLFTVSCANPVMAIVLYSDFLKTHKLIIKAFEILENIPSFTIGLEFLVSITTSLIPPGLSLYR